MTLLPYLAYFAFALWFSSVDIRVRKVPRRQIWIASGALAVTMLLASMSPSGSASERRLLVAAVGAFALWATYVLLGATSGGALGGGDARFAVPTGMVLGYTSADSVLVGGIAAFALAAIVGLIALGLRAPGRRRPAPSPRPRPSLPFVPFMSLGAAIGTTWPGSLAMLPG